MKPWKYVVAGWMTLVIAGGFLIEIPDIPILEQTARNIFFHVPMWMTMFVLFLISFWYSIKYLNEPEIEFDMKASSAATVGVAFGVCGLLTGSLWARFTWGSWWTFAEPKMNLAALALMIYVAYFMLRSAFDDEQKRAKLAAVYNIFAVTTIPFLLYVVPRQLTSLHPGADGNPAFSEITADELRYILYPAFIGFIALGYWIYDVVHRYKKVQFEIENS
ncbi:cytochrome c biogenesis protein [Gracilimonas sediminicola]|uniref:Cytochrome c biogenesis protein n=1 Tax=Gracilimonas sediminicola TaxID=2952158 RepID=A0A9X2L113_9BACT|nr:cytochrome c biogenesis protein [Gracilimonas sediminicola]MCP9290208.1 cytochrome c biogenesis protein [Gracilimonas sediminicola]